MNIKSLKFMILVIPGIVLSFMSSNAYCMGTFKTGFHKLCKAVNVGITFYPWVEGIQNISNKKEFDGSVKDTDDAPESVQEFVYNELHLMGLAHLKPCVKMSTWEAYCVDKSTGKLIPDEDSQANARGFTRAIIIEENELSPNNLVNLLKDRELSRARTFSDERLKEMDKHLNKYRNIVQHEAVHVKNNDLLQQLYINPFLIPLSTFAGAKVLKALVSSKKTLVAAPLSQGFKELLAGFCKGLVNKMSMTAYEVYVEQRADDGVIDDPATLQGGIDFHIEHDVPVRQLLNDIHTKHAMSPVTEAHVKIFQFMRDPHHPPAASRIERFKERIVKLGK